MLILTIRTDNPEAEIGLFDDTTQIAYKTWTAHRQLAETLHATIQALLATQQKDWHDLGAVVCFKGPGSFTGLRIGITVANALAYGLNIPVVASLDPDWIQTGIQVITHSGPDTPWALPEYGAAPHITAPRK